MWPLYSQLLCYNRSVTLSVFQGFYSCSVSYVFSFFFYWLIFLLWAIFVLYCFVMASCGASAARASVSPCLNRLHLKVLGCKADLDRNSEVGCVLIVSTCSLCWPFLSDQHKGDSEGQASAGRTMERDLPPNQHIMPEDAWHCFSLFPHGSDL